MMVLLCCTVTQLPIAGHQTYGSHQLNAWLAKKPTPLSVALSAGVCRNTQQKHDVTVDA
jgi:hypothetical protein